MSKSISRNPSGNFTSGQRRTSQNLTKRVSHQSKKFLDSRESSFYWILTVLCMISTWSDSFFLYSFKVNGLKNCLELESHAAIAATVCRTVFDFLIILPCINERGKEGDIVIRRQKWLYFWLDVILSNFPLPQLAVIIMIGRMRSSTRFYALRMLKYVIIFQYLPRVLRIYRFYRQAESTEGILTQHIWVNVSCCFLIYPLDGQILGGLCYLLAIERLTECWRIAGNTIVCTMIVDTTVFDFGMFQEVILSGVLEKDLMTRFMFCFNWGLQTIRSLGGNFNTSTDVWENLFAVFIYLFCVISINVLVLGKVQILLLSESKRLVDMRVRVQEIVRSKTFKMLSTNRQEQIKSHLQYVWQETGVVDGQHFLDILPSGLQEEVLRELCLEMLKKVYVFKRRFDEKILEEMYSYLKPKFYAERHSIVRKDDRIKEMLFIIHGTILSAMTANDGSSEGEEYRDGEFWGEEIAISCLHPHWNLEPMSKVNVIAATKVQAFALKLDDIKKALEKISKLPNRYSEQWRTKNARIIQKAWRTYKKKKKCSILFDYRIPKAGLESCSVGAAAMDSPLQMNGLPISVYAPETVGCVVLDREGQCAAATSTGGLMNKMSGRIGNSSLIGAAACAVSCTGEGEAIIRGTMAVMEYEGLELQEAVDFFKKERLDDGQAGLTAVSKKGEVACGFISS